MRKWILTWILPPLLYRSCLHLVCLVGTMSLACNDMTPEQTATNGNCSSPERHTRSYDYMEGGDIRVRRLFCRTQWYLRIDKRGKVKGTQEMKNSYSKWRLYYSPGESFLFCLRLTFRWHVLLSSGAGGRAMQDQLLISLHWGFCNKSLKCLWEQGKCTHLKAGADSTRQWKILTLWPKSKTLFSKKTFRRQSSGWHVLFA